MSQSEPRRCHTASLNWLRIMRNQKRFCPKSWLSRPARPSGSRQDNAGNHKSHPTGWAHDATGRDARGVGQRYAARSGSSYSTVAAWVNAAGRSAIACKRCWDGLTEATRPTNLWRGYAKFRAGWRDGADADQPRPFGVEIKYFTSLWTISRRTAS